ncbi:CRISPR-associated protein, Cas1 family [Desulfurobacterium pacificum]|uniref:CRISPR-associated endonuclease Cas1 n=1 Tax=Desulfurobacterium pacificum TaxID=240166 RepID=A0ABY1NBF4_9BACT|nr:CRISPR-associated endonuclease Cas1 [Desulfurobacterium pacificum]SMP05177.1 CRISPR-associated protein, Cas1 family [Desulfurobacterium pacificum]
MKGYLFVTTPGACISRKGNVLIVETTERKTQIPIGIIKHVFLFGTVNITVPAIRLLSSRGKFVFLLNRYGRLVSVVYPEFFGSDNNIRMNQYLTFSNEERKIAITKELLQRKLEVTKLVIYNLYASRNLKPENLNEWAEGIRASILSAENLQSLLGIDGNISRYLYGKFSSFNESPFYFERREYYPPPDPVNALLSLSFSIFYSIMHPLVLSFGFDPYLGFFHIRRGKHAALCSDVMEIVRPRLAEFVFTALNDEFFEEGDFSKDKGGMFLRTEALKSFVKLFSDVVIHGKDEAFMSEVIAFLNWLKEEVKK